MGAFEAEEPRGGRGAVEVDEDVFDFAGLDSVTEDDVGRFHMVESGFPVTFSGPAVVGGEVDDGIVHHAEFFELIEDLAESFVGLGHRGLIFRGSPADRVTDMVDFAEVDEREGRFRFELFEGDLEDFVACFDVNVVVDAGFIVEISDSVPVVDAGGAGVGNLILNDAEDIGEQSVFVAIDRLDIGLFTAPSAEPVHFRRDADEHRLPVERARGGEDGPHMERPRAGVAHLGEVREFFPFHIMRAEPVGPDPDHMFNSVGRRFLLSDRRRRCKRRDRDRDQRKDNPFQHDKSPRNQRM